MICTMSSFNTSLIGAILSPNLCPHNLFFQILIYYYSHSISCIFLSCIVESVAISELLSFILFPHVSYRQAALSLLFIASTNSILLQVKVSLFQLASRILFLFWTFFTRSGPVWCKSPCLLSTATGHCCSASLKVWDTLARNYYYFLLQLGPIAVHHL